MLFYNIITKKLIDVNIQTYTHIHTCNMSVCGALQIIFKSTRKKTRLTSVPK